MLIVFSLLIGVRSAPLWDSEKHTFVGKHLLSLRVLVIPIKVASVILAKSSKSYYDFLCNFEVYTCDILAVIGEDCIYKVI